jgi:hypothetical protein
MAARGRKSASSLMVAQAAPVHAIQRPDPPDELTEEQARVWYAVTESLPAEWFGRETHDILAQYCRHVVAARRVAQLIAQLELAEAFDIGEYDTLLKMQEREGRALSSLATRMRLTQQTTYDKSKAKGRSATRKPWET